MEITKDIFNTGKNVTRDRLYSAIDTVEELYEKKNNLCCNKIPTREGLPVALKTAKERQVLFSEFMWKTIAPL